MAATIPQGGFQTQHWSPRFRQITGAKHMDRNANCRKQGAPRLQTRTRGGNWQGDQYLSYAEHDRCMRAELLHVKRDGWQRGQGYALEHQTLLRERRAG